MARHVTSDHKEIFSALIQEQAEQHHSAAARSPAEIDNLWQSVGAPNGINAFLIVKSDTHQPVVAVTYFGCLNRHGLGLYLEDIVTTSTERNKGAGKYAMSVLAQIALDQGASRIVWECARSNDVAHRFYDHIGASRVDDRHTQRKLGLLPADLKSVNSSVTVRRAKASDQDFLRSSLIMSNAHEADAGATLQKVNLATHKNNFIVAIAERNDGMPVGIALAYRNFSTFRVESGIHVDHIAFMEKNPNPDTAYAFLDYFADLQRAKGWNGHFDFTVHSSTADFWHPILMDCGVEPLAYGDDVMDVRHIFGPALVDLAEGKHTLKAPQIMANDNRLQAGLVRAMVPGQN